MARVDQDRFRVSSNPNWTGSTSLLHINEPEFLSVSPLPLTLCVPNRSGTEVIIEMTDVEVRPVWLHRFVKASLKGLNGFQVIHLPWYLNPDWVNAGQSWRNSRIDGLGYEAFKREYQDGPLLR